MSEQEVAKNCGCTLERLSEDLKEVQADYDDVLYRLHCLVDRSKEMIADKNENWGSAIKNILSDVEFGLSALRDKLYYIHSEVNNCTEEEDS